MPQEIVLVERVMKVLIDYPRAKILLDLLHEEFKKSRTPYHRRNVPQNLIPASIWDDPAPLAVFLFYTCLYMRGTIRSDDAIGFPRTSKKELRRIRDYGMLTM